MPERPKPGPKPGPPRRNVKVPIAELETLRTLLRNHTGNEASQTDTVRYGLAWGIRALDGTIDAVFKERAEKHADKVLYGVLDFLNEQGLITPGVVVERSEDGQVYHIKPPGTYAPKTIRPARKKWAWKHTQGNA